MSQNDYYETLGVAKNASEAELKKAYRKQAMKYHPDRNPGDKIAEKKFKEAGEAYDALRDPQKRAAYDQYGHAAFKQGAGGRPGGAHGFGGFGGAGSAGGFNDFTDMFEDLFGDAFGGSGRRSNAGAQRGADLRYNLTISLEDAFKGATKTIKIPTQVACSDCSGTGAKKGTQAKKCGDCNGHGEVRVQQGFFTVVRTCPKCQGVGKIIASPCPTCHGNGRKKQEKSISVNIPAGVDAGTRIRLSNEGEAGTHSGPAGDLYLFIALKKHKIFTRDGMDLHVDIPLDFVDACLGGSITVPTIDGGKSKLNIPEGTQSGQQFRMRSKGMPEINGSKSGNMYVTVYVEVPTKLSKKQKELLRQFRNETSTKQTPEQSDFTDRIKKFWNLAS